MNKYLFALLGLLLAGSTHAQAEQPPYANTIEITADDTPESIVDKAAHIIPSPRQLEALRNEFIAFIHLGPNTFTRMEWGNGMEDPRIFDLKELDTDQWCEAMSAAGMRMVILTAKHHDGFCLWQSRYTRHGIMSTGFRDGKGDIMKELSASCRKYGLKLGVYLSPADLYHIEQPDGLYGNLSQATERTIPREVPGRPFADKRRFRFVVDDYNEYFLNQLFELLTEYGPIHEVWFDGAHPKRKGGQTYNYAAWEELIRTLAPEAVIFGRSDIRWCGNESGKTRATEWNVLPYPENPETGKHPDRTGDDLGSRDRLCEGRFLHYQQAETNTSIREGWFYRDDTHQKVRSTDDVFDIYERAVGGNSTFLLNIPPNREGRFSAADVAALKETGARIRETYGTDLLHGARGPKELLDGNDETYVETAQPVVIKTRKPVTFNRLVLQEAVSARGERVEGHAVDAWIDGAWKEIAQATNIGYKRILRFPEVTTDRIRLRITSSRRTPGLATLSAHYYRSRPPRLVCRTAADGTVAIEPYQHEFGWKAHNEKIAENLNAGFEIHYTTDGSEPDARAPRYTEPFTMAPGVVKAVAILGGRTGAVLAEQIGFAKSSMRLASVSSETPEHPATAAFDADPHTYWMSGEGDLHRIDLDLGCPKRLTGFAYTPQTEHARGMIAKGAIYTSDDGQEWTERERFEFGNLINDPTKRYHYFSAPVEARFVRIEASEIAENGHVAAIAEIDLF